MLATVEYQDASADFAEIYLEDSWVLDVAVTEQGVAFRLDAVLRPDHTRYRPPASDEQHCYLRAMFTGIFRVASATGAGTVTSSTPSVYDAWTSSALTPAGRGRDRVKAS